DEERGEVAVTGLHIARPTLAMGFEELGHHVHRVLCGAAALEAEPDQVHADERVGGAPRVVCSPELLVADGDAMLVHAVLESPQPRRTGPDQRARTWVGHRQVLRAQLTAARSTPERLDDLRFANGSVRVLAEHGAGGKLRTERIAHEISLPVDRTVGNV